MVWILKFPPTLLMFYLTCIFEISKLLKTFYLHCLCPKSKCIVFGAPYERGSPDRGNCLYIRLSPALCFLLKHCPHISNYVLALPYVHISFLNKLTLPYILYIPIKSNHKKLFTILLLISPSQLLPAMVVKFATRWNLMIWYSIFVWVYWSLSNCFVKLHLSLIFGQEERILLEGIIAKLEQFPENM